jgi:peroxiredoxin
VLLTRLHRRTFVLPLAAIVIAALTIYRLNRGERPPAPVPKSAADLPRTAPSLAIPLSDQHKHPVKLERYYGRAPVVIVFFDKDSGADHDPYLTRLRDCFDKIDDAGIEVVGISRATPYENQQAEERAGTKFPFPLLSDVHPQGLSPAPVHIQFGLFDTATDATRTAMYLIDRAGRMPWDGPLPRAVDDPAAAVEALCRGEWPVE